MNIYIHVEANDEGIKVDKEAVKATTIEDALEALEYYPFSAESTAEEILTEEEFEKYTRGDNEELLERVRMFRSRKTCEFYGVYDKGSAWENGNQIDNDSSSQHIIIEFDPVTLKVTNTFGEHDYE